VKPVFAWAVRKPDGSLLFDHITGAPWLSNQRGYSVSDCEVAIILRSTWDTLTRQAMSETSAAPAEPTLAEPVQTDAVPIELAWANDIRIRIGIQPIVSDDGVVVALGMRVGASAGWMTKPDDMLLLSAEINPMQLRLARNPVAVARAAVDDALRAILDALRQSYEPPPPATKIIL